MGYIFDNNLENKLREYRQKAAQLGLTLQEYLLLRIELRLEDIHDDTSSIRLDMP